MKREVKYDFSGSVALVTGAAKGMGLATAKGMGLATAKAFAAAGAKVVIADVVIASFQIEADKITKVGGKVLGIKCDLSSPLIRTGFGSVCSTRYAKC